MFNRERTPSPLGEDWTQDAWEDPWRQGVDPRSHYLDKVVMVAAAEDIALYGDGGYSKASGASFASQGRAFGPTGRYWEEAGWCTLPVMFRFPLYYGYDIATIHTAELAAMVSALRWRRLGAWNLYVGDRSSIFGTISWVADGLPSE